MGCPLRVRFSVLVIALCAVAGCGGNPESAGAAGTAGTADAPIGITIANTYVSVENRTGAPLLEGEMVIDQLGVRPPFRAALPRLENGSTRGGRDALQPHHRARAQPEDHREGREREDLRAGSAVRVAAQSVFQNDVVSGFIRTRATIRGE
jgi:hypothetical protein